HRLCDLGGLDSLAGRLHLAAVGCEIGLEVKGEQRTYALGQRVRRDDVDLFAAGEFGNLPRAHNDIAIIGQQNDLRGGAALHRLQQILRAGVHRLATGNDAADAEALEELDPAIARRHRDRTDLARRSLSSRWCWRDWRGDRCPGSAVAIERARSRSGSGCPRAFGLRQAVLAGAIGGVAQTLRLEVLDVDILQTAEAHAVVEDL